MDELRLLDMSLVDTDSGDILYRYKRTLPLHEISSKEYPMRDAMIMVIDCALRGLKQGKGLSIAIDFHPPVYNVVPQNIPF